MGCSDSMDNGCHSCMAASFRISKVHATSSAETNGSESSLLCCETVCDDTDIQEVQGAWVILLSLTAFIGPVFVTLVVVQFFECRVGSLVAAIAGLAAAALTVLMCVGIARRLNNPSEVAGAER